MEELIKNLTVFLFENDCSNLSTSQIIKKWQISNHITLTKDTDLAMIFSYCEQFKKEKKNVISAVLQQL